MKMAETVTGPVIEEMLHGLRTAVGTDLRSVVLYGSAARGDYEKSTSDLNLLIVLDRLNPATLEQLKGPVTQWERRGCRRRGFSRTRWCRTRPTSFRSSFSI